MLFVKAKVTNPKFEIEEIETSGSKIILVDLSVASFF